MWPQPLILSQDCGTRLQAAWSHGDVRKSYICLNICFLKIVSNYALKSEFCALNVTPSPAKAPLLILGLEWVLQFMYWDEVFLQASGGALMSSQIPLGGVLSTYFWPSAHFCCWLDWSFRLIAFVSVSSWCIILHRSTTWFVFHFSGPVSEWWFDELQEASQSFSLLALNHSNKQVRISFHTRSITLVELSWNIALRFINMLRLSPRQDQHTSPG